MAAPARLNVEQAATVFRRAAELEAAGVRGDAVLDDQALEDAGREVGLSPASIREALAELRGGALVPGPAITWGTVSSSRAVAGPRGDVLAALDDVARRNLLGVVRSTGAETVWVPSGFDSRGASSSRGACSRPAASCSWRPGSPGERRCRSHPRAWTGWTPPAPSPPPSASGAA
jgi:hypothetical protein